MILSSVVFVGLMDSEKVHLERFGRKIEFIKANNTCKFQNFIIFSTRFSCKSVSFQFYNPQIILAVLQEIFNV